MSTFFDTHCHLDHAPLAADQAVVIERARAAGVTAMVNIVSGTGVAPAERALATATAYDGIYAAIGVHPHEASLASGALLESMAALAPHPKLVAWGEIGLDFHYNRSPPSVQEQVFETQLDIAQQLDLPVVLHVRNAAPELLSILRRRHANPGSRLRGIWHCFTETLAEAEGAMELGFYISISGIATYKKAAGIAAVATQLPLERLLIETDSPYLAPAARRGRRNEPAFLIETARAIASWRGITLEELAAATTSNARRAYGL